MHLWGAGVSQITSVHMLLIELGPMTRTTYKVANTREGSCVETSHHVWEALVEIIREDTWILVYQKLSMREVLFF